jgi:hypothetical protein
MMEAPAFLLPRPEFDLSAEKAATFERLWQSTCPGDLIDYSLPYPKWQFLSYLCDTHDLVLHGSQHNDLQVIEPQQAHDTRAYSNQCAIYASTDGIWVIFFAIVNRKKFKQMSLFNSCLQICISPSQFSDPYYFFSISQPALLQNPWQKGMVYILPRRAFEREASQTIQGAEVVFPHWISKQAVSSAARLMVSPEDFPFLEKVHGHNDEKLSRLAAADPNGFPWPEALES